MTGAPAAVAVADFRERTRRTSYVVILLGAVAMAFAVLPDPASGWQVVQIDAYAGRYTSAYVGTTTAIAGAVWLGLPGFYVVRGSIARDTGSRVGQVLAATPMRTTGYLVGKATSNLLVLASMVAALAAAALALQLWRGEGALEVFALAVPFVVITLPAVAVIAASALVFDTVPLLRAGLGNVVWFFGWLVGALAAQGAVGSFDVLGVRLVSRSMSAAIAAEYGDPRDLGVGIGLVAREEALLPFTWTGVDFPAEFLVSRVLVVAAAAGAVALTAAWFRRFDEPAAGEPPAGPASAAAPAPVPARATFSGGARSAAPVVIGFPLLALVTAELRILVAGASRWWFLGAAALVGLGAVAPVRAAAGGLLVLAWLWPVLLWSRSGTAERDDGVDLLLGAYPTARRRVAAQWAAGAVLAAAMGGPALVRMAATGDVTGVAAWAGGCAFVPALALALGTVSRTPRLFQVGYLALSWAVLNEVAALDFAGAVRVDGVPAGPGLAVFGPATAVLLAVTFAVTEVRHGRR